MPPRKKEGAPAEATRRSARIADKPAESEPAKKAPAKKTAGKKRAAPAEKDEDEPASKKAKPASKPAAKPASKAVKPTSRKAKEANGEKPAAETVAEKSGGKAAEAEAKAEAPADAPPETKGAKELELGDVLPDLTLKNQAEEDVAVKSLITADKGLILFLVPKANTPGCTTQACGFRDAYPSYTGLGYEVYCLSADAPSAQAKWKTAQELPYPLLSDKSHALIKALGASASGKTKRSHFVFEKGTGKLILKSPSVKPVDSPKQVLEFLKGRSA